MINDDVIKARDSAIREALRLIDSKIKVLGIGTGSTMAQLIGIAHELGILKGKQLVASSMDTALRLKSLGYNVLSNYSVDVIDLYIDSADEVDRRGRMIKGGGGALLNEKLLASYSNTAIFVVDYRKLVNRLGSQHPVPIEVVPNALSMVLGKLRRIGVKVRVREGSGKKGPVISDSFGVIIDAFIPKDMEVEEFNELIRGLVGVVETGLFLSEATEVYVGYPDRKVVKLRGPRLVKA